MAPVRSHNRTRTRPRPDPHEIAPRIRRQVGRHRPVGGPGFAPGRLPGPPSASRTRERRTGSWLPPRPDFDVAGAVSGSRSCRPQTRCSAGERPRRHPPARSAGGQRRRIQGPVDVIGDRCSKCADRLPSESPSSSDSTFTEAAHVDRLDGGSCLRQPRPRPPARSSAPAARERGRCRGRRTRAPPNTVRALDVRLTAWGCPDTRRRPALGDPPRQRVLVTTSRRSASAAIRPTGG
jgi:hypothetical protein